MVEPLADWRLLPVRPLFALPVVRLATVDSDHFRLIPDRLESLLSEKRFLSAVVLLVRSLKAINKPEMMEIGALADLRSWLVGQEGVSVEGISSSGRLC